MTAIRGFLGGGLFMVATWLTKRMQRCIKDSLYDIRNVVTYAGDNMGSEVMPKKSEA